MIKTSSESGSGLGLYAYHYSILNNHLAISTSGNADSISQGNTSLTVYNQFRVTERVSSSAGNYLVSVQRAFCEINLSTINSGRLIAGGEIILNGLSNVYNGCKIVLVAYNGGSTWSTSYFETGLEKDQEGKTALSGAQFVGLALLLKSPVTMDMVPEDITAPDMKILIEHFEV